MASADFSQFVVTTANETACETSPVKVRVLFLHVPAAFTRTSGNLLDFSAFCHLIRISEPYMRFLSVRSEVCLQLLSDSVSRRTPLLFSYVLRRCLRALGTCTRYRTPMLGKQIRNPLISQRIAVLIFNIWLQLQDYSMIVATRPEPTVLPPSRALGNEI